MMLCFRGSDYRRSWGLTWYNRMDSLLIILGFIESKADSNLQGWRWKTNDAPVICQWLVPDRKEELIKVARRRLTAEFKMKDLDMMHYFLGMEVWYIVDGIFHGTREVCSGDPEEVQDDGLQGHDYTYGIEPEAIEWCFIRSGWCYDVSSDDWVLDVLENMRLDICFAVNTLS